MATTISLIVLGLGLLVSSFAAIYFNQDRNYYRHKFEMAQVDVNFYKKQSEYYAKQHDEYFNLYIKLSDEYAEFLATTIKNGFKDVKKNGN